MLLIIITCVFFLIMALCAMIIACRFHKFIFVQKVSEKSKWLSLLISLTPIAIIFLFLFINIYTVFVVLVHLAVIWLVCDFVAFIVKRIRKNDFKRYYSGAIAIIFTVFYLSYGWFCAHHIYKTDYTIYTSKNLGKVNIRVVEIADAHLGITLSGKSFSEEIKEIQRVQPDIVVIAGDFVDNATQKAVLIKACKALGELKTTYGVYYIYGNHDIGAYSAETFGDFDSFDLDEELQKNNIKTLEDETVLINNSFYLIGRDDRSFDKRENMQTLTKNIDKSKYILVADHQPNDYKAQEKSGVDLVLSGHTHGGHIFPTGYLGLIFGANDKLYGKEVRENTTFIVSSGISGWGIPFKTGAISEFVVIDIKQK